MAQIIFAFTFNTETKDFTHTSNIQPPEARLPTALKILQDALISQAIQGDGKKAPKKVAKAQE